MSFFILNKNLNKILKLAQRVVKIRLEMRESLPSEILYGTFYPASQVDQAKVIFEVVANSIGISPAKLRHDDKLSEVLSVRLDELINDGIIEEEWKKAGLTEHVDPFAYDIFYALERKIDQKKLEESLKKAHHELPDNEEAVLDFLFLMDLKELISLLGPSLKNGSENGFRW